jgi:hypothetical protein
MRPLQFRDFLPQCLDLLARLVRHQRPQGDAGGVGQGVGNPHVDLAPPHLTRRLAQQPRHVADAPERHVAGRGQHRRAAATRLATLPASRGPACG